MFPSSYGKVENTYSVRFRAVVERWRSRKAPRCFFKWEALPWQSFKDSDVKKKTTWPKGKGGLISTPKVAHTTLSGVVALCVGLQLSYHIASRVSVETKITNYFFSPASQRHQYLSIFSLPPLIHFKMLVQLDSSASRIFTSVKVCWVRLREVGFG
jgi:hypothetical protein